MTEHKFTDEEIMQHMLAYADRKCNLCEVSGVCCDSCIISRIKEGVYLINRKKAEVAYWMDAAANAKKEAVKEFAEKLKKECLFDRGYEILQDGTIDHLAKEFTEE